MRDIVGVAIPGKLLLAVWEVTGGITQFANQANRVELDQGSAVGSAVVLEIETTLGRKRPGELDTLIQANKRGKHDTPQLTSSTSTLVTEEDAVEETVDIGDHLKAVKRDDAAVRTKMWQYFLLKRFPHIQAQDTLEVHLDVLRAWLLRRWKRGVTLSFLRWLRSTASQATKSIKMVEYNGTLNWFQWTRGGMRQYRKWSRNWRKDGHSRDFAAGSDGVWRAAESSWWVWDVGSACFYWRWPACYQQIIRDGMEVRLTSSPPEYRRAQRDERDKGVKQLVIIKLEHSRTRRYIEAGEVRSLMSFFAVSKGEDDIRMVYDASKSGLNDIVWVPRFPLPTIATHLRAVECGTYMADLDVGEMFLNFNLHSQLQELCGVDLTHFCGTEHENVMIHERWTRAAMGLRSSPYQAVQAMTFAEEVILGDPRDKTNPFRWDRVRLNLPGQRGYDPSLPWVSKVRTTHQPGERETIASDVFIYVDDIRVTGPTEVEGWEAAKRVSGVLTYLGIQDAARKRREPRQDPGAWAGAVLRTDGDAPAVEVSLEKWVKTKALIAELREMIQRESGNKLHLLRLLQIRGFLLYVTRTYRYMTPHLKGLHLTIDGWREGRDTDGWRTRGVEIGVHASLGRGNRLDEKSIYGKGSYSYRSDAPEFVQSVPRLKEDIEALERLTSDDLPPALAVRCRGVAAVFYGFGDASGKAFGSTFQVDGFIRYRYGQWCSAIQEESSNYKELGNLVSALGEAVEDGTLEDCEVFLFTDNSTAEGAYYKGNSPSRKLFELVLQIRKIAMSAGLILHVLHVSGKRMIAQGTDGLSRGDHTEGVMQGRAMLEYVPLHLTAFERSPKLKDWFALSFGELNHTFLEPEGWFGVGHQDGNFIWAPPPAAADVVVEQLGKARHKRPHNLHVIVVPRLMTGYRRRALVRESDGCFEIRLGFELWPRCEFEPLIVFVCCPFRSNCPSGLTQKVNGEAIGVEGTKLEVLLGELRSPWVWEEPAERSRDFLRKLLTQARGVGSLPEELVW
jgi:hypothetical protein